MIGDRRHRFDNINSVTDSSNTVVGDIDSVTDSSNTVVRDIDSAAVVGDIDSTVVVGDTITTIGPPVMTVQWSKTPIRWAIGHPPQAALLAEPPVLLLKI